MSLKQFDQQQKLAIVEHGKEIGFKEAAKIAGVHYTTVYDWQRQLDALGRESFLNHRPHRPGRGIKQDHGRPECTPMVHQGS
jgi:putative transposase